MTRLLRNITFAIFFLFILTCEDIDPTKEEPISGTHKVGVFLIEFNDVKHRLSPAFFAGHIYSKNSSYRWVTNVNNPGDIKDVQGSIAEFYKEVSYGKFDLFGSKLDIHGWYSYPANKVVVEGYNAKEKKILKWLQNKYEDTVEKYNKIFIIYAGVSTGIRLFQDGSGFSELWPHMSLDDDLRFCILPEMNDNNFPFPIGTGVHEFGHVIGMKDYYDVTSLNEKYEYIGREIVWGGVGGWCVMAGGGGGADNYNSTPNHISAHLKYQLGWLTPHAMNAQADMTTKNFTLRPVEKYDTGSVLKLLTINKNKYLLMSFKSTNVAGVLFDKYLKGTGLLIWQVDKNFEQNLSPIFPRLAILEADGKNTMRSFEKNENNVIYYGYKYTASQMFGPQSSFINPLHYRAKSINDGLYIRYDPISLPYWFGYTPPNSTEWPYNTHLGHLPDFALSDFILTNEGGEERLQFSYYPKIPFQKHDNFIREFLVARFPFGDVGADYLLELGGIGMANPYEGLSLPYTKAADGKAVFQKVKEDESYTVDLAEGYPSTQEVIYAVTYVSNTYGNNHRVYLRTAGADRIFVNGTEYPLENVNYTEETKTKYLTKRYDEKRSVSYVELQAGWNKVALIAKRRESEHYLAFRMVDGWGRSYIKTRFNTPPEENFRVSTVPPVFCIVKTPFPGQGVFKDAATTLLPIIVDGGGINPSAYWARVYRKTGIELDPLSGSWSLLGTYNVPVGNNQTLHNLDLVPLSDTHTLKVDVISKASGTIVSRQLSHINIMTAPLTLDITSVVGNSIFYTANLPVSVTLTASNTATAVVTNFSDFASPLTATQNVTNSTVLYNLSAGTYKITLSGIDPITLSTASDSTNINIAVVPVINATSTNSFTLSGVSAKVKARIINASTGKTAYTIQGFYNSPLYTAGSYTLSGNSYILKTGNYYLEVIAKTAGNVTASARFSFSSTETSPSYPTYSKVRVFPSWPNNDPNSADIVIRASYPYDPLYTGENRNSFTYHWKEYFHYNNGSMSRSLVHSPFENYGFSTKNIRRFYFNDTTAGITFESDITRDYRSLRPKTTLNTPIYIYVGLPNSWFVHVGGNTSLSEYIIPNFFGTTKTIYENNKPYPITRYSIKPYFLYNNQLSLPSSSSLVQNNYQLLLNRIHISDKGRVVFKLPHDWNYYTDGTSAHGCIMNSDNFLKSHYKNDTNPMIDYSGLRLYIKPSDFYSDTLVPKIRFTARNYTGSGVSIHYQTYNQISGGEQDEIGDTIRIGVYTEGGALIKEHFFVACGERPYTWDFKDSAGQPVPNGKYTVQVESHDVGGNTGIGTTEVVVDNQAVVAQSGGTTFSSDENISLNIPEGALSADTTFNFEKLPTTDPSVDFIMYGMPYSITPSVTFNEPVELVFSYADFSGITDPSTIGIYYKNPSNIWEFMGGQVDTVAKTVTVSIAHLSTYALGKANVSTSDPVITVNLPVYLKTNSRNVTVSGTISPGAFLRIKRNDKLVYFKKAMSGNFSVPITLPDGITEIKTDALDLNNRFSVIVKNTITIDSTLPKILSTSVTPSTNLTKSGSQVKTTLNMILSESVTVDITMLNQWNAVVKTIPQITNLSGQVALAIDCTGLTEGIYKLSIHAKDSFGNIAKPKTNSFKIELDETAPIASINPMHRYFASQGNSQITSGAAVVSYSDNKANSCLTKIEVLSSGNVVRTLKGSALSFKTNETMLWDGKNDGGSFVSEGSYSLRYTVEDQAGNTKVETTNAFLIDNTVPTGSIISPSSGLIMSSNVSIVVSVADANLKSYRYSIVSKDGKKGSHIGGGITNINGIYTNDFKEFTAIDGEYIATLEIFDKSGNKGVSDPVTFTIDQTAPTITITGIITNHIYNKNGVTPVVSVSDPHLKSTSAYLVLNSILTQTYTIGSSITTEGKHILIVTASDTVSNISTYSIGFAIDSTPPITGHDYKYDGVWINKDASIKLTVYDPTNNAVSSGVYETSFSISGATNFPGMGLTLPVITTEGTSTVTYYSTDNAGNREDAKFITIMLDKTAPEIAITGFTNGRKYGKTDIVPGMIASDLHMKTNYMEISKDSETYSYLKSGTKVSMHGSYTVRFYAEDVAGNKTQKEAVFNIDTIPPRVPVNLKSVLAEDVFTITWDNVLDSDLAGYNIYRNGEKLNENLLTNNTYSDTNMLTNQVVFYTVSSVDDVDNESDKSVPVYAYDDGYLTIDKPQSGKYFRHAMWIKILFEERRNRNFYLQYSAYQPDTVPGIWTRIKTKQRILGKMFRRLWITKRVSDGVYLLHASVDDKESKHHESSRIFMIDHTKPETKAFTIIDNITNQVNNKTTFLTNKDVKFYFSAYDPTNNGVSSGIRYTKYHVSKDKFYDQHKWNRWKKWKRRHKWTTNTQPIHFTNDGKYKIKYYSKDNAELVGNKEKSKSLTLVIDKTPPAISVNGIVNNQFYSKSVKPSIIISDTHLNQKSISMLLDNFPFINNSRISGEGKHVLTVTASDTLGNVSTAQITFTIDETPPVINVSGVEDGITYYSAVTPQITVSDANLSSKTITLNGASYTENTVIQTAGSYELEITATDKTGNKSKKKIQFVIKISSLNNLLSFYASFDNGLNADFALGSITNHNKYAQSTKKNEGYYKYGLGASPDTDDENENGKGARYKAEQNFNIEQGSICLWVKPDWKKLNKDEVRYIFSINGLSSSNEVSILSLKVYKEYGTVLEINDALYGHQAIQFDNNQKEDKRWYGDKKWTHFVVQYDANKGEVSVYINGIKKTGPGMDNYTAFKPWQWSNRTDSEYSPYWMWFGSRGLENDIFEGYLDEIRLYTSPLDEDEVRQVYKRF